MAFSRTIIDSDTATVDLSSSVSIGALIIDITNNRLVDVEVRLGGSNNLTGTSGYMEFIVNRMIGISTFVVGANPELHPIGPQTKASFRLGTFFVPAGGTIEVFLKSPESADTSVDATTVFWKTEETDIQTISGNSTTDFLALIADWKDDGRLDLLLDAAIAAGGMTASQAAQLLTVYNAIVDGRPINVKFKTGADYIGPVIRGDDYNSGGLHGLIGVPFTTTADLTDATGTLTVRRSVTDVLVATLPLSQIVTVDAGAGDYSAEFEWLDAASAESELVDYKFDMEITDAGDKKRTFAFGEMEIVEDQTRA